MAGRHDLVIGGSGMLANLCFKLADRGSVVSVVARDSTRLQSLASRMPGHIFPIAADYRDTGAFGHALGMAAKNRGRLECAFCWIHDEVAPEALLQAADHVDGAFWHILGSAAGNPADPHILSRWRERFQMRKPGLDYRQIVLGFVPEAGRSRWLTDAEISEGVYSAAQSGDALRIVGSVDPWSRRP